MGEKNGMWRCIDRQQAGSQAGWQMGSVCEVPRYGACAFVSSIHDVGKRRRENTIEAGDWMMGWGYWLI